MASGDPGTARDGVVRHERLARHARPALAGLLLLIVVLGDRAALPSSSLSGRWHADGFALFASLDAVLASLLLAVLWRRRHRPEPGYPAAELRAWLKNILAVAVTAVTAVAVLTLLGAKLGPVAGHPLRLKPHPLPTALKNSRHPQPRPGPALSGTDIRNVLYVAAALLALGAIGVCLYLLWLRRSSQPQGADPDVGTEDDTAALRDAVDSGRSALRVVDDSRAAIIACYAAMETSLAGAGAVRTVAETPDELLGRARRTGLLRGAAAARLVSLFYEARFSSHPMPAPAREAASLALDAISAELRDAPAQTAAAPSGEAGAQR